MKQNEFPLGRDEKRVQSVIDYYENQTEDEAVAEDESGPLIEVPTEKRVHDPIPRHFRKNYQRMQTNKGLKQYLLHPNQ